MGWRKLGGRIMRCGTLFSGGGGVEIGLEMLGYEGRWGVENNPAIADVYEENFPSSIFIERVSKTVT